MRKRWPLIVTGVVLFLAFTCYSWDGPPYYYADPIRAAVVDFETSRPVAGAVVVAIWWLNPGIEGTRRLFHLYETKTDANGAFFVPGWRPKVRPACFRFTFSDPEIYIYRPGYLLGGGNNHEKYGPMRNYSFASRRTSDWNGKVFHLRPAHTLDERVHTLENLDGIDDYATTSLHLIWVAWKEDYLSLPSTAREQIRASGAIPGPVTLPVQEEPSQ